MEIELKFKLDNPRLIENKIKSLGAKFLGKVKEFDIYFDDKKRTLSKQNKVLRLRKAGKDIILTFKEKTKKSSLYKEMEEMEFRVSDFKAVSDILNKLSFFELSRKQKIRKKYKYNGCYLCIDKLPNLCYYLEIEADSKQKINLVIKKLNLDRKSSINLSYPELLLGK